MKIIVDRNVVEFSPESPRETADLEVLWRVLVDCVKESKQLTPIGEFVPQKANTARFVIEGVPGGTTDYSDHSVSAECTVYCQICNKYANLKPGDSLPNCCGRPMETLD
ncbi:MAG: hypothetical protein C4563_04440 [Desulfobulbus sp.]|jgi:hypothetical protein|nr:MAG: hypothetical protein C4563_04440 [Desulfobulbus sp.]